MKRAGFVSRRSALLVACFVALLAGVLALRSVLGAGSPPTQEQQTLGDLPTVVFPDGSIQPDPNKLGIGPEGNTYREPDPRDELIANLAKISEDRKLTLAGGQVIGVVGTCSFPHNYDPASKCIGLHDLRGLSNITVGLEGEIIGRSDRSSAGTAILERLLDDPVVKGEIIDFMKTAPAT